MVLVFLNLYAATTMRNFGISSKQASGRQGADGGGGLLGAGCTAAENAEKSHGGRWGNLNATRVLVTDESGKVLYDNMEEDSAMGQYAVLPEIVLALGGNDVFSSSYWKGRLKAKRLRPFYMQAASLAPCT